MRLSHIAVIYFLMGAVVLGSGVVPADRVGLAEQFIDVEDDGSVTHDEENVSSEDTGMIHNLIGSVQNTLSAFVPQLLAVWGPVSKIAGFVAWPVTVANYINAPTPIVLTMGVLSMSMVFGVLKVFRGSI